MFSGIKPYGEYGRAVEGLAGASLPSHWGAASIRRFAKVFSGGTPSREVPDYWEPGTVPWLSSGAVNLRRITRATGYISELGLRKSSAHWIAPGSVVLALAGQGRTKGMIATVEIPTTGNQSLAAIEPADRYCRYEYLGYFLESRYAHIRRLVGDGLRDGLNLEHVKSLVVALPPLDEQAAIVRYLAHANRRIDRAVAAKRKLIRLLEEQKQVIINQAVTRGLDASAPFKG